VVADLADYMPDPVDVIYIDNQKHYQLTTKNMRGIVLLHKHARECHE
jgi:hypothetical protein